MFVRAAPGALGAARTQACTLSASVRPSLMCTPCPPDAPPAGLPPSLPGFLAVACVHGASHVVVHLVPLTPSARARTAHMAAALVLPPHPEPGDSGSNSGASGSQPAAAAGAAMPEAAARAPGVGGEGVAFAAEAGAAEAAPLGSTAEQRAEGQGAAAGGGAVWAQGGVLSFSLQQTSVPGARGTATWGMAQLIGAAWP